MFSFSQRVSIIVLVVVVFLILINNNFLMLVIPLGHMEVTYRQKSGDTKKERYQKSLIRDFCIKLKPQHEQNDITVSVQRKFTTKGCHTESSEELVSPVVEA